MNFKKFGMMAAATCIAAAILGTANPSEAQVFVGSYKVDDGPSWTTNPKVYSPIDAAVLLFGGDQDDYFISVNPSLDPTTITHTGHLDVWGGSDVVKAEDFSLDNGAPGYNDPGGFDTAESAYVFDHFDSNVNYVWQHCFDREDPVDPNNPKGDHVDQGFGDDVCVGDNVPNPDPAPEPCGLAMMSLGVVPLFFKRRGSGKTKGSRARP